MNNFIYENRTKVFFGQGCVKEFLSCLIGRYDTILLAYGQGSARKNGIYDEVLHILLKEGKNVVEFPGIMPNPTYKKVMEGGASGKKYRGGHDSGNRRRIRHGLLQSHFSGCPV